MKFWFRGRPYTVGPKGYWRATTKPKTFLARDMWEAKHGTIPEGHEVHHIDEDKNHNTIDCSNFELKDAGAHARHHNFKRYHEAPQAQMDTNGDGAQ